MRPLFAVARPAVINSATIDELIPGGSYSRTTEGAIIASSVHSRSPKLSTKMRCRIF
jgi:hypothetical protein